MLGKKLVAAVCAIAAVVLLVGSVIQRDAAGFWMPYAFFVGMILLLVATFMVTYRGEEAAAARARLDAEAKGNAAAQTNPS